MSAVLLLAALASVPWSARPAAATAPALSRSRAGTASDGAVLVLVRRLTWGQAAAVARAHGGPVTAGLVSTLPADASLPDRVLSLAAGRRVDAGALAGGGGSAGADPAAVERMRAGNPDATFGGLPPTRVLAAPSLEAAGLLALGSSGAPPPATPLQGGGPLEPAPGELLAIAVPDAAALQRVLARVPPSPRGGGTVLVVGLESPPGRAQTAPLLVLGGASGVATSDSTRRRGLVAMEDVRPTLAQAASGTASGTEGTEGTEGSPVRVVAAADPPGAVGRLDRQVSALVAARSWAVVLYAVVGTASLAATLLALLVARGSGRGAGGWARLARTLLLTSVAMPSGYLLASAVAPASWVAWLLLGLGLGAALALAAWLAARGSGRGPARSWPAPALLGALLAGLIVLDLLVGGAALSRPLLGNSAFDGERFYGLGNGYFAYALAGIFLVLAFRPLPARAAAALLAGLAVVDGLPSLGADVGGALTSMLTAAAAWLLLGRARPGLARTLGLLAAAAGAAAVVAIGAGLVLGEPTHGSRIARELLGRDSGSALRAVGHQLSGNFGLLAGNFWAWWGPLLVGFAGLASVRPPALLAGVPAEVRQVTGVGAVGSFLLILLNDTGVTAAAGIGLALVAALAWSALEPARAPGPARSRSAV